MTTQSQRDRRSGNPNVWVCLVVAVRANLSACGVGVTQEDLCVMWGELLQARDAWGRLSVLALVAHIFFCSRRGVVKQ